MDKVTGRKTQHIDLQEKYPYFTRIQVDGVLFSRDIVPYSREVQVGDLLFWKLCLIYKIIIFYFHADCWRKSRIGCAASNLSNLRYIYDIL